jgi:hypothetical protein
MILPSFIISGDYHVFLAFFIASMNILLHYLFLIEWLDSSVHLCKGQINCFWFFNISSFHLDLIDFISHFFDIFIHEIRSINFLITTIFIYMMPLFLLFSKKPFNCMIHISLCDETSFMTQLKMLLRIVCI